MAVKEVTSSYIGISNENEFYSQHYLSEIFKGDIKSILDAWQATEAASDNQQAEQYKTPFNRLKALHKDYFAIRDRLSRAPAAKRRIELQRDFFQMLLSTLGYQWHPQDLVIDNSAEIPILAQVAESGKPPTLLVLGAYDPAQEQIDPLSLSPLQEQFHTERPADAEVLKETWNDIITKRIFAQSTPPRWILLLSDAQLVLIDRSKWNQNRLLRFDWLEILGRREEHTLRATAALLHADSLTPGEGVPLLDTLDENSHKHAFAVSEDLKFAIRAAIELLGNEAAEYLIENTKVSYTGKQALDADQLTRECLRYMYRLLFLFYIEARPDLGYVPLQSPAYRNGYSLESLRDLELVRLTSDESRNGYYLHFSIEKLFSLIHEGYSGLQDQEGLQLEKSIHNSFHIQGLDSHLFDPQYTKLLNKVRFRNETLQRVIQMMSLTRPAKGRKRRGRISYAQLGINQLGSVYEALLSYRGFFADKDLYEVKKAGTTPNELETGYFVSAEELDAYTEEERVYDKNAQGHKELRVYPKGKFIYRLAGRDRQKSASYYTPEVLTKTLVKYALKELLKDKTADEILSLTVCEPAMGSAAFLNEAVNQLSEAYLEGKQAELDTRIPHEDYAQVLQQTRMVIADHNVFGVDLNPVSVELAEVSLWLNCIHGSSQVPWFGYQLFAGNSLIGARRQVYGTERLQNNSGGDLWFKSAPVRIEPTNPKREPHQVYHFLLPDPGMADYKDKVAKSLAPDEFEKIKKWRKEFTKSFTNDDIDTLQHYSTKVDELWAEHTRQLAHDRQHTEDELPVWGQPESASPIRTTTREKDRIRAEGIFNLNAKTASAYRRLKMVMDYWCALWFWPIDKADLLPDRDTFLMEIGLLLTGNVLDTRVEQGEMDFEENVMNQVIEASHSHDESNGSNAGEQTSMPFPGTQNTLQLDNSVGEINSVTDSKGQLNIERLFEHFPRLRLVHELAERNRFFHWELTYADIFNKCAGFDLVLGNPPWIKVEWKETGIMGDYYPLFEIRGLSSAALSNERERAFLQYSNLRRDWFSELETSQATQQFLTSIQNYKELSGIQPNLYKYFFPQSWYICDNNGVIGLIHDEGIFTDGKGGEFRSAIYPRLKYWFAFQNEKDLFKDVGNEKKFELSILRRSSEKICITSISNLFHPVTIDQCFLHSGDGIVPGLKNNEGKWELMGHKDRIVIITEDRLRKLKDVFNDYDVPVRYSVLPSIHANQLLTSTVKLVKGIDKLCDLKEVKYISTRLFEEKKAEINKTLIRKTQFPDTLSKLVFSGPHIFVATPFYQTPRSVCDTHRAYDSIDIESLGKNYLPRSNYIPNLDNQLFSRGVPEISWEHKVKMTSKYRLAHRRRLNLSQERTFISAIIPPGPVHINSVVSSCFQDTEYLLNTAFITCSLVFDYWVKLSRKSDFLDSNVGQIFISSDREINSHAFIRVLMLNCLTEAYESLWKECWKSEYLYVGWTKTDKRLLIMKFEGQSRKWNKNNSLYTLYTRRQALVEIDVLAAMTCGIDLDELISIYRVQFPVMKQNEADTWYDDNGRVVFTVSKGLVGVGLSRKANRNESPCLICYPDGHKEKKHVGWEDVRDLTEGTKIIQTKEDDTLPGGPRQKTITYVAPFDRCDREEDYKVAWAVFEERFKNNKTESA